MRALGPRADDGSLDVVADEIDTTNTAVSGMRTISRPGGGVIRVENVPAMAATAHAIINNERHDNTPGAEC